MNLSDTIERKFVESYDVNDYEIWTDTGWEDITHTNKTIKYQVYKIILENGMFLECADDHIIFDDNMNEIFVKDCIPNKTFITTEQGASKVKEIIITDEYEHMYDISVNSDNHRYYTNGILSHNTTIMAAYLVWYVLFPDEPKNVAILANKEVQAIEIMDRIKLIYENLPQWIQQGVKVYNKKSIELENMCRIFCASTSSSAIRGKSVNLIYLDEFAFVPNNVQENFYTSTLPTISSGDTTKIIITSTPNGFNLFYKIWDASEKGENNYVRTDIHYSEQPGRDEAWAQEQIKLIGQEKFNQEYNCLDGDTIITLYDKKTKETFDITIRNAYEFNMLPTFQDL